MNMHLIEYAIRYCMTRDSYAFEDGLDTAEAHWDRLSHATKADVTAEVIRRRTDVEQRWPKIAARANPQRDDPTSRQGDA